MEQLLLNIYTYVLILLAGIYLIFIFRRYEVFSKTAIAIQEILSTVKHQAVDEKMRIVNQWFDQEDLPKPIKETWNQYYTEFRYHHGKVMPDVFLYFSDDVVYKYGLRKFAESVPATFVSFGILGTFLGITIGMGGLNQDASSAELEVGVQRLLDGMSIAFLSSIVGIVLSLVIQFIDKTLLYRKLYDSFYVLRVSLEQSFPVKSEPVLLQELVDIQTIQFKEFKSFLAQDFMSKLSNNILSGLSPYLNKSNEILEQVIENTKDIHNEKMNKMIRYFVDSLNDISGEYMKELGETLNKTIEWQERVFDEFGHLIDELKGSATQQSMMAQNTSNLSEKLERYTNTFTEEIQSIVNKAAESHQETSKLQKRLEEFYALISEEYEEVEIAKQHLTNALTEQLEQLDERTSALKSFWSSNQERLEENRQLFEEINKMLHGSMESFSDHMHQGLGRTFDQFDKQLAISVEYLERGVSNIRTVIETMEEDIEKVNGTVVGFQKVLEKATKSVSRSEG